MTFYLLKYYHKYYKKTITNNSILLPIYTKIISFILYKTEFFPTTNNKYNNISAYKL